MLSQPVPKLIGGHWFCVKIALSTINAAFEHKGFFIDGFNAFGNDLQIKRLRDRNNRPDELLRNGSFIHITDKALIQFDRINRDARQL